MRLRLARLSVPSQGLDGLCATSVRTPQRVRVLCLRPSPVAGCPVFMVLADSSVTGEVASGFLTLLKEDFTGKYGQKAAKMGANALDKQYG